VALPDRRATRTFDRSGIVVRPYRLAVLIGAFGLVLSACAPSANRVENPLEAAVQPTGQVRLGDAVFAFYLSPETYAETSESGGRKPAYVVLVQPDGSYRTVRTSGMNTAQIAWSDLGLFFSDEDRDYILGANGLTTFGNPKSGLQQSAFALPDRKGFVAVYNKGFTETGYANQVAVTTPEGSRLAEVEGNYFTNASCEGAVYGVAPEVGDHIAAAKDLPRMRSRVNTSAQPQLLARLHPAKDGREKVVAWRAAFGATAGPHAPCVDGVITFLSAYDDADGRSHAAIVSWDTATGRYVERPLVDGAGKSIGRDALEFLRFDDRSLREGTFEWFATDGHIMATEVETGVTTSRFDTGYAFGNYEDTKIVFTDTSIYALNEPFDGKTPVTFKQFDRATGKVVKSLTLDGISEHLGVDLNVRGFAVRPER
jgi:hypothetical protein